MSVKSLYANGGKVVPQGQSNEDVLTFLGQANSACTEAWILAKANANNNGPLRVRLYAQNNHPLSDEAQIYGQTLQRTKLVNVNIPSSGFPPVVRVVASNDSTTGSGEASCEGVLLVYN